MRKAILGITFLACIASPSCDTVARSRNDCDALPAGRVIAFFGSEAKPPSRLHGRVEQIVTIETSKGYAYDVLGEEGARHRLTYRASEPLPGVVEGGEYDFDVEYVGGYPAASAIIVSDSRGVLFVGVTDQAPKQHVLKTGIDGFEVTVVASECPTRPHSRCYDAIVNQKLRVTRQSKAVLLMNGQSAFLDGYQVRVLTAQKVTYRKGCADAGLDGVSFTIAREK